MASPDPFWLAGVRWRLFWAALTALPLVWPALPPLEDLPGHIARFRIAMEAGGPSPLAAFYDFHWRLIGNLGLDLLVPPLAGVVGLEPAVKIIVLLIPPLTAWGMMAVAREAHGRMPPTVLFALPLALGWPFVFGFVNFALAVALAFNAFALWLALGRQERLGLRAALFVPIGLLIWLTHAFGWGILGLLAFAGELARLRVPGDRGPALLLRAGLACLPLAPPLLLTIIWQTGETGGFTSLWFDFAQKAQWLAMALRDRWQWFDIGSVVLLIGLLFVAIRHRLSFSRPLAIAAFLLLGAFLVFPWVMFASAYADMRLAPFVLALALLAIGPVDLSGRLGRTFALMAVVFFLSRIGATTVSFALAGARQEAAMAALDHVPRGAKLLSFVVAGCDDGWHQQPLDHLPSMAVVRREAFANDQWFSPSAPLVTVRKADARGFSIEPSQIVTDDRCPRAPWRTIGEALHQLPRPAFDYLWIIDGSHHVMPDARQFALIWSNGRDSLFRISHDGVPGAH